MLFDQFGFGITVFGPGAPLSMYHWESDEEDFLNALSARTPVRYGGWLDDIL